MKHMLAKRIIIVATLMALTFSAGGAAPAQAAGIYTHTWFVEHTIADLQSYDTAHPEVDYSELLDILNRYPADVNYGSIFPDYTYGIPTPIDADWGELIHDTNGVRYRNYTLYLQFLAAKYPDDISSKNIDRQTSHYKEFLNGNYGAQVPSFRAALMSVLLPSFQNPVRSAEDEKKIAFLFGLIAHQEADTPWHWDRPDCNSNWKGLECLETDADFKDPVLHHYDVTGPDGENTVEFDFYPTAKQIVLAASDIIGRRPVCALPCWDALDSGHNQIQVTWGAVTTDLGSDDSMRYFLETYVPGGIHYGAALTAAAWMQTWDVFSDSTLARLYVKPTASGNGNCESWENACQLQYALNHTMMTGQEIWAAVGTYKPTTVTTDRTATFLLKHGVNVYGGFSGTETAFDQRDPAANLTILSGDVDNNDSQAPVITDLGTVTGNTTNSYHVVTGANEAALDGFTVTAGYADGTYDMYGGGMINLSSPTVTNVTFSGNFAGAAGGGMYNDHSHPTLTDVTFQNNTANYGGGIENFVSSPVVANTTFVNNTAANGNGGGMHNASQTICNPYGAGSDCHIDIGSPALTNVTFSGNAAKLGGGIDNDISSPTLTNVTFNGNTATTPNGGGSMHNRSQYTCMHWFASICTGRDWYVSAPMVRNSLSWGNGSEEIFNEIYKEADGTPPSRTQISNSVVQGGCPSEATCTNLFTMDPKPGTLGNYGGFTPTIPILAGSSAIDTGDDSVCPAADQRGVSRPQGSHCDIGAYEYQPDTTPPTVLSVTRMDANPGGTTSVRFSVTFSEAVTGVNTAVPFSDFALTSTGVIGASITSVIGSGTTYVVTVNTGSGKGTIRLDVVDDDSIRDGSNNPLGGTGTGNGNYTSGEGYTITAGADATGVFRPDNGLLYLKNKNDTGFADYALNYGLPGDYPVVGDWDGNGTVTIGIYRGKTFYLRNENTLGFATIVFDFGQAGDQPIAGDWNGDGVDTIGTYRPSIGQFQLRNSNDAGPAEMSFYLGNVGDVGVAGDWNGDGVDTTGVFRPSNGIIFLKDTNDTGFADYALNYGLPGDKPVMGDWDNDGIDTIGIYRNGTFYLRNENTNGFATIVFGLGNLGDHPIAGNWDGLP